MRKLLAGILIGITALLISAPVYAAQPPVKITNVKMWSPSQGDDENSNLNGEWVVLKNTTTKKVSISGWRIHDQYRDNTYVFPSGTVIRPKATIKLYSGQGRDTATALYWGRTYEQGDVWESEGDEVFLRDRTGKKIHWFAWIA